MSNFYIPKSKNSVYYKIASMARIAETLRALQNPELLLNIKNGQEGIP